jgi:signal transduction histidine kinase
MRRSLDAAGILAAAAALLVTLLGAIESSGWIDRTFPGFLVLGNRVIASAGLAHWPAARGGEIYQHEILAVDGWIPPSADALQSRVGTLPAGVPVTYRLGSKQGEIVRTIATRRFGAMDFFLLFGPYLFCGIGLTGIALGIRFLRGSDRVATGSALCLWIVGMYALTALDLYGPYRLFRLHVLIECLLFAGTLHMALVFPHPSPLLDRLPRLPLLFYGAGSLLALAAQLGLPRASSYVVTHRVAVTAFGAALLALIASQVWAFVRPRDFRARQRVKVLAAGAVGALAPQVALAFLSASSGGQVSENAMGWSGVLFPLAVGYAVLRKDLLEVDSILRRSVSYLLMTLLVALVYGAIVAGFEALFRDQGGWGHGAVTVLFVAATINLLLPLRDRVQSVVDRLFFRSVSDFRRHVEVTSARLARVAELHTIGGEIASAVEQALHPEWLAFFVHRAPGTALQLLLRRGEGAPDPMEPLAGRGDLRAAGDGTLRVPFHMEGDLVALLVLGRRLSGRYYGAEDRALLSTLANQGAVAVRHALALDELRELNASLESRVEARTIELARALDELRDTQAQLVHREKMASLGQFVAGIAHELNNPMNFIRTNLFFLRQYGETLRGVLQRYEVLAADAGLGERFTAVRHERGLDAIVADLASVFEGCQEGVGRAMSLVEDLRSFSRLDLPERTELDLHAALDSTLNLLSVRLGGIRVVKEYGELPAVHCLVGQIHQVFMNLLANAADAVGDQGTIRIRTARVGGDRIAVEVEDDGCGIEPELIDRIFDPFFTTKEVGRGTGLGLAITHGVVARHGGAIEVRSQPGRGSCFRVELPVHAPVEACEAAAAQDPSGASR